MTTDRPFRVNTKKARSAAAKAECAEELGALFSCMMVNKKGGRKLTAHLGFIVVGSVSIDLALQFVVVSFFLTSISFSLYPKFSQLLSPGQQVRRGCCMCGAQEGTGCMCRRCGEFLLGVLIYFFVFRSFVVVVVFSLDLLLVLFLFY